MAFDWLAVRSAFGTEAVYVDVSQRAVPAGSGHPAVHFTSLSDALIPQYAFTGASPCGNIIMPASVVDGRTPRRSTRPALVASHRVAPLGSLMCMLPERSRRKRTFEGSRVAVYW